MEHDIVPSYTPSSPSPRYSYEPLSGEQTIEITGRASSRAPTGVYRRITNHLTIVLRDQHPGCICPIYRRGGFVHGDVILADTNDLASVTFKLEGHFLLHASGVPVSTTFLSMTRVLWSGSHVECCPRTIPFEVIFPLTFDDGGQARPLPPTFQYTGADSPHMACSYSLTIEVSRARRFLSFFKGYNAVKIPLLYQPRSTPHLPMLPSDLPFMCTVKTSPEEWHEVICTVPMTRGSGLAPVECLASSYSFPRCKHLLSQTQFHSTYRFAAVLRPSSHSLSKTKLIRVRSGKGREWSSEYIYFVNLLLEYTDSLPRHIATSAREKWNPHNPYMQEIVHQHRTLLGKVWTHWTGTEYLDATKMPLFPVSPQATFPLGTPSFCRSPLDNR